MLKIARGVLQTEFTTRNTLAQDAQIHMRLTHGPFRDLTGDWRFEAIGERGSPRALSSRIRVQEPPDGHRLQCRVRNAVRHHRRCLRAARAANLSGLRIRSTATAAVEIVYAEPQRNIVKSLRLAPGAASPTRCAWPRADPDFSRRRFANSARRHLRQSGAAEISRSKQGDRIEIYRPLARIRRKRAAPAPEAETSREWRRPNALAQRAYQSGSPDPVNFARSAQ